MHFKNRLSGHLEAWRRKPLNDLKLMARVEPQKRKNNSNTRNPKSKNLQRQYQLVTQSNGRTLDSKDSWGDLNIEN